MRRVPGETIARRILRDDEFADGPPGARRPARPVPRRPARHRPRRGPRCRGGRRPRRRGTSTSRSTIAARPSSRRTDWLADHRPAAGHRRRSSTAICAWATSSSDPTGLAAVIDWEIVHVGDPLEDLAWLCVKAWRFGEPLEVGGLGTIDELVDAYEARRRPRGRPRRAALVARRQDADLGHRVHDPGRLPPVGPGALGRPRRGRPAGGRAGVGPHRADRARRLPGRARRAATRRAPRRRASRTDGRPHASCSMPSASSSPTR